MKNLSKVLAVVLALVMALSMVSFAAYTDVADDANYAEAVSVLSSLEMLKGYEDGTFKPEGDITRAEFAMVVCRLLGYGAAAEKPAATQFADVAADHWASGAIALAAAQGIVNGYGNGNFGPEDNVTYEQAIKMVVAALGYTVIAEANGGYPGGFQIVAAQAGILDGITDGVAGVAASRGVVAQLAYNALDVPMVAQTGFGTEVKYDWTNALLLNRLDVVKAYADIKGTAKTDSGLDLDEVKIKVNTQFSAVKSSSTVEAFDIVSGNYTDTVTKKTPNLKGKAILGTVGNGYTAKVVADDDVIAAANELLDREAVVYIKGAASNKPELVAITAKEAGYSEIAFSSEYVNDDETTTSKLAVYNEDKTDFEKFDIAIGTLYVNGRNVATTGLTLSAAVATVADTFLAANAEADIRLLDSNADEIYDVAYVTTYADYVVKKVYADDYELSVSAVYAPAALKGVYTNDSAYTAGPLVIDLEDETVVVDFIKDGAVANFSDIAEGDVLSVAGSVDTNGELKFGTVVINTQSVAGKITGLDKVENVVYIDDVAYDYNGYMENGKFEAVSPATPSLTLGNETTFYINARGVICGYDTEAKQENIKYGFVTDIEADGNDDFTVRMMNAEGVWSTYGTAKKVTLNGTPLADNKIETVDGALTQNAVRDVIAIDTVVGYELNGEGEIKTLYTVNQGSTSDFYEQAVTGTYNATSERVGTTEIANSAVIFNAPATVTDESDVTICTKDALVEAESYTLKAWNIEDGVASVLYGNDVIGRMDFSSDFMVITAKVAKANANEDAGYEFTGIVNGETVSMFATDADADVYEIDFTDVETVIDGMYIGATKAVDNINIGDVILFTTNAKGEANKIVRVVDGSTVKTALDAAVVTGNPARQTVTAGSSITLGTTSTAGEISTWYLAYVAKAEASRISVLNASNTSIASATAISLKKEPVTTVVDFFAAGNKTNVEAGNIGRIRGDAGLEANEAARNTGDIVLVRATNSTVAEDIVVFKAEK